MMKRDNSIFGFNQKQCTKFCLIFTVHFMEKISTCGKVVVVLEKTGSNTPTSAPAVVNPSSNTAMFKDQELIAEVQFVKARPSKRTALKPKLIRVLLRSESVNGATITSTYFNATLYVSTPPPGEKVRIQLDDGSQLVASIACVPSQDGSPATSPVARESPTSIMKNAGSGEKLFGSDDSPSGILKGKLKLMQGMGSIRDLARRSTQAAETKGISLEELQKENSRLHKLIGVTKKTVLNTEELKKQRDELKYELEDLTNNGLEFPQYLQLVEELCDLRKTKANLQMNKENLQHTLSELMKPPPVKKGRNKWR